MLVLNVLEIKGKCHKDSVYSYFIADLFYIFDFSDHCKNLNIHTHKIIILPIYIDSITINITGIELQMDKKINVAWGLREP